MTKEKCNPYTVPYGLIEINSPFIQKPLKGETMGKVKQSLIIEQENMDLDYRPFKPIERLSDVEVSAAYLKPATGLLEGREWIPSNNTDVTRTWRRFGWRPIAEIIAEGKEINKK